MQAKGQSNNTITTNKDLFKIYNTKAVDWMLFVEDPQN